MTAGSTKTAPGQVRIIGGQWKRSKLPVANIDGLRPSADRVRETLFNWLGQDLSGWRCLDAFAGSGALGFEAASRGAASVMCVELNGAAAAQLRANKTKLQASAVQVYQSEALPALAQARELDLIFLDPPFRSSAAVFENALRAAAQAVSAQGWVYLEAPRQWQADELQVLGLEPHRHLKAGMAHAHLLRRTQAGGAAA